MEELLSRDTHPLGAPSLVTGQLVWVLFCFPFSFNKHQIIPTLLKDIDGIHPQEH